jgi:hypothetical protein
MYSKCEQEPLNSTDDSFPRFKLSHQALGVGSCRLGAAKSLAARRDRSSSKAVAAARLMRRAAIHPTA